MSSSDKDLPTYEISSAADRERIIAEVVAHASLQEAQYRQPVVDPTPPGTWKLGIALVVLCVAGAVAAFPPWWLTGPVPGITSDDRLRGLRAAVHIQAQQLEAHRAREGRLPRSLDEVPLVVSGIHYVRSNNRIYQLVVTGPDGTNLVYDSARPAAEFAAVADGWFPETSGS